MDTTQLKERGMAVPNYVRSHKDGGCFFLTLVTYERTPLFRGALARELLRDAIAAVRKERPWTIDAAVLLPDHAHFLWTMPLVDSDYSSRIARIKKLFTRNYLSRCGNERPPTSNQRAQRRRGIWQPRFWEHTIRDATDFKRHLDYIHINPVKHKLVSMPKDWPWSTFMRHVRIGEYEGQWVGPAELPGQIEYYSYDG